jgi:hypothetical protein
MNKYDLQQTIKSIYTFPRCDKGGQRGLPTPRMLTILGFVVPRATVHKDRLEQPAMSRLLEAVRRWT